MISPSIDVIASSIPCFCIKSSVIQRGEYVKNISLYKDGNILTAERQPVLDLEEIREEGKYDGYCAIESKQKSHNPFYCDDVKVVNIVSGEKRDQEDSVISAANLLFLEPTSGLEPETPSLPWMCSTC